MPDPTTRKDSSRAVTLDQVSNGAGISRVTTSRTTAGSRRVTVHSRQGVEDAFQELDYEPAPVLREPMLACHSVAVVITESTTKLFGDPFFSPLLKGIYTALAERSLLLVMLAPQSPKDQELTTGYLLAHHVDGVILASLHGDNPLPQTLRQNNIPVVVCGRPPRALKTSCVDSDNRQGGALAVNHLLSLGRRRVAIISGNLDMPSAVDRLNGYRDALTANGIELDPTLEEVADYLPHRAHMAMERLLLNHPDVDGVFCASDLMGAAAVRVLHQARKRIPEDVAVIGFDDSPTASATRPQLSSIRQPIEELGHEAVNVLIREMQEPGEAPRQVIFATELVIRESTVGAEGLTALTASAG